MNPVWDELKCYWLPPPPHVCIKWKTVLGLTYCIQCFKVLK